MFMKIRFNTGSMNAGSSYKVYKEILKIDLFLENEFGANFG